MRTSALRLRGRRSPRSGRHAGSVVVFLSVVTAISMLATASMAYWSAGGSSSTTASTDRLAPPTDVTIPTTAYTDVPVSWTPGVGGVAPTGYTVTRRDAADVVTAACGSSPVAPVEDTACTDAAVPDGTYTYVVTAVHASWTASSAQSASAVAVHDPVPLGAARTYSILARTAVVSTGPTAVSGDLGVSPGTVVTGFPPGTVGGDIHAGDASAAAARTAFLTAYADLANRTPATEVTTDLGGRTFTPGIYHSTAALALTGSVTLDGQGDTSATFIFQTDAAFDTAAASHVILTNGAQASNVFWVVAGAAGTGASSFHAGTILAVGAITLGASTELIGRALSGGTVTLAGSTVRFTDALPPSLSIDGGSAVATADTTPTITGTSSAPPSSRVVATIGGQAQSTVVGSGGAWNVTTTALAAGTYVVVVKVRDSSGNGTTATQLLTVEVNPETVPLGAASTFSALAFTAVVNTGVTDLSGDLGVSPGTTVTGFPPGTLAGAIHAGDPSAAAAQASLVAALGDARGRTPHTEIVGNLGGRTFHVGVHHGTAAMALTGTVTLDGQGDPGATFIFQTDAAFDTAAGSHVNLINGADAANVFWVVTGAAGTGADSFLAGTILAEGAITLGAGTHLTGRALSRGTITLAGNAVIGVSPASTGPP